MTFLKPWTASGLLLFAACGARTETHPPARSPDADAAPDVPGADVMAIDTFVVDVPRVDAVFTDVAPDVTPTSLRPLAPISTARLNTQRPTFRWLVSAGAVSVTLEVFADRACTQREFEQTAPPGVATLTPDRDFARGVHFWRVRADFSGRPPVFSSVWEFLAAARTPSASASSQVLGLFLDVNGDGFEDAVIGAPGSGSITGRAHFHYGASTGLARAAAQRLEGTHGQYLGFGMSVEAAGDLNGDGFGDLAVASAQNNPGWVDVYFGGASGVGLAPDASLSTPDMHPAIHGTMVRGAGDLDGDGYGDLLVGARGALAFSNNLFLYRGSASGLRSAFDQRWNDPLGASGFGTATVVGDFNADGALDLAVALVFANAGVGRVDVFNGSPSGAFAATASTILTITPTPTYNAMMGDALASGDVNGDGVSDLIVGVFNGGRSVGGGGSGEVRVYLGSREGLRAPRVLLPPDPDVLQWFGFALAARDVDGDGLDDILVGAPQHNDASGLAYAFRSVGGGEFVLLATLRSTRAETRTFGLAVALGDYDADGVADALVGMNTNQSGGAVSYHRGGVMGLAVTPSWADPGPDGPLWAFGATLR